MNTHEQRQAALEALGEQGMSAVESQLGRLREFAMELLPGSTVKDFPVCFANNGNQYIVIAGIEIFEIRFKVFVDDAGNRIETLADLGKIIDTNNPEALGADEG